MQTDIDRLEKLGNAPANGERAGSEDIPAPRLGDLLEEVELLILHYLVLPARSLALVIATWIAMTYSYERFDYAGYLALRSATPRCGKTRLLRLGVLRKLRR